MCEVHLVCNRMRLSKRMDGTSRFVHERKAGVYHVRSWLHERVRGSLNERDGEWASANEEPKRLPFGSELMHTDV